MQIARMIPGKRHQRDVSDKVRHYLWLRAGVLSTKKKKKSPGRRKTLSEVSTFALWHAAAEWTLRKHVTCHYWDNSLFESLRPFPRERGLLMWDCYRAEMVADLSPRSPYSTQRKMYHRVLEHRVSKLWADEGHTDPQNALTDKLRHFVIEFPS